MTSRLTPTAGTAIALTLVGGLLSAQAGTTIFSGTWTPGGYEIEGGWSVVEEDGERFVDLDEDFRTRRAPDLKIFLSPLGLAEIGDGNATEGAVLIAVLEKAKGAQRYAVDGDVDLDAYQTIVIHCELYSKYWGGATLTPPSS